MSDTNKKSNSSEINLVTLAILTYERAQVLKTMLESEGIEASISNVGLIHPVVSGGVRVRIQETDLPKALRLVEDSQLALIPEKGKVDPKTNNNIVLIPIDFSPYSLKATVIGFNFAYRTGAHVHLIHAYFSPYFPSAVPMGDTFAGSMSNNDTIQKILAQVEADKEDFVSKIDLMMKDGKIPDLKYEFHIREGLPEEEILNYAKYIKPKLIVMGTRGKSQKDMDLIGSVTGEVLEDAKCPVMVIPENAHNLNVWEMKKVGFATRFLQNDLVLFDKFMDMTKPYSFSIDIFNVSTSNDEWDEIRLKGVSDYFRDHYPNRQISNTVIDDGDLLLSIEDFIRENKIEMVVLSTKKRGFFSKIFNPSLARKMLFHTNTPIFSIRFF